MFCDEPGRQMSANKLGVNPVGHVSRQDFMRYKYPLKQVLHVLSIQPRLSEEAIKLKNASTKKTIIGIFKLAFRIIVLLIKERKIQQRNQEINQE